MELCTVSSPLRELYKVYRCEFHVTSIDMDLNPSPPRGDFFDPSWLELASSEPVHHVLADLGASVAVPHHGFAAVAEPPQAHLLSSSTSTPYGQTLAQQFSQHFQPRDGSTWNSDARGSFGTSASVSEASSPATTQATFLQTEYRATQNLQTTPATSRSSWAALQPAQSHFDSQITRSQPKPSVRRKSTDKDLRAKAAHSVVERRYRGKLNDKMMQLHQALLASELIATACTTVGPPVSESGDGAELSESTASKVGKAEIMGMAIDYVNQAEVQLRHARTELRRLRQRVAHLEAHLDSAQVRF